MMETAKDVIGDGSWIPLAKTGTHGEKEITRDDLDAMIGNFEGGNTKKIPVVFGRPSKNGPTLAQLDAMKRDGDTLKGRLSGVDPRAKRLIEAGLLKKKVVQVQGHGMPEGPSVVGVGLVQRRHGVNGVWEECPETEAGFQALCDKSGDLTADSEFADRGAGGLSVSFEESPWPRKLVDTNGQRLVSLAKTRAQEKTISFGEALSQVAREHPELTTPHLEFSEGPRSVARQAVPVEVNSAKLSSLAKDRAKERSISFGEALSQVARERPELTIPHFEFGERQ